MRDILIGFVLGLLLAVLTYSRTDEREICPELERMTENVLFVAPWEDAAFVKHCEDCASCREILRYEMSR